MLVMLVARTVFVALDDEGSVTAQPSKQPYESQVSCEDQVWHPDSGNGADGKGVRPMPHLAPA